MQALRRPQAVLVLGFLAIIAAPAAIQTAIEWRRDRSVQALSVFRQRPTSANLRAYEHELEDASWVGQQLRPWVQYAQFRWLHEGGDKALVGRDGWLFYRPSFLYLTQRNSQTDQDPLHTPVAAIVDFRDRLAARGIQLLVVLAPNKETIYPEMLSRRAEGTGVLVSTQTRQLLTDLARRGVEVVDLGEVFRSAKQTRVDVDVEPLYLRQDSHWSPAGVEIAAAAVARRILDLGWTRAGTTRYTTDPAPVSRLGDLVRMLQVPQIEMTTTPEQVPSRRVMLPDTQQPYVDHPDAPILVMGDSFLRIYQQDEPGAAGFIAHLAQELQQPLTSLVNDGGASTLVRQELYRRPALLRTKRVVVWEFVERDIRFGTEGWQCVPLPPE